MQGKPRILTAWDESTGRPGYHGEMPRGHFPPETIAFFTFPDRLLRQLRW